jgi:ribulose-phosphate 3-epimerase
MVRIAPSILAADLADLASEVKRAQAGGCDLIHIDVMDGLFAPNLTIGPGTVKALRRVTDLPLDVHLMIENPRRFVKPFALAESDILTVHIEACENIRKLIGLIKEEKMKVGVALNPETELSTIEGILERLDMVVIMSVHPGFAGQEFIPEVLSKIETLKAIKDKQDLKLDIEVDGGINLYTARRAIEAGADILVAGAGIYGQANIKKAIESLRGRRLR